MNDHLIDDIPVLQSIEEIAGNYDAWLVDLWGVIHNGETALWSAVEACERYRAGGGIVILLSNAPRPWPSVRDQIEGYGVPSGIDDGIVTSGDVTRALIAEHTDKAFFFLGPERDKTLFDGIAAEIVEPEEAEIVLLTGLYDDSTETPEDYRPMMEAFADRDLPMICANPDIKVERGNEVIHAAGGIAALYETLGGRVVYAGKPYLPIYQLAFARIDELAGRSVPHERILAIGDGIDTDIKGAVAAQVDPVFIPSPVHLDGHDRDAPPEGQAIAELFAAKGFKPMAALPRLQW